MMNKKSKHKLIDGTFAADDAAKILLEIINNKINYHNLQIFSITETSNGNTDHSEKRIEALLKTASAIRKELTSAQKKGYEVKIQCPIEITILKK